MKYLNSIFDKWFNAICWSSLLLGIFIMKKWVESSLTSFGTLRFDCVIKTIEMFNFLPHQKLLTFYVLYLYCIAQFIYRHLACHFSIQQNL